MTGRVLLVDDDAMVLSGLKRALCDEPYRILTETSAVAAIEIVGDGDVDVVVSDHDMPEMNGAELLAEVRRIDPTIVRLMLTGKATLELAIRAINEGTVDRFFTKPCNRVDLAVTIRSALDQRSVLAEARRLLWLYRRQKAQIEELERLHPQLAAVDRDDTGAILLEDLPTDADALRELMAEVFRDAGAER